MQVTRPVNEITINESLVKNLIYQKRKELIDNFNLEISRFVERFYDCTKDDLVIIQNKNLLYINSLKLMVLDTSRQHCSNDFFQEKLYEYKTQIMQFDEAESFLNIKNNPLIKDGLIINKTDNDFEKYSYITVKKEDNLGYIYILSKSFNKNQEIIHYKYSLILITN